MDEMGVARFVGGAGPVTVFVSYAPEDEALRKRLEKHLSALRREEAIVDWSARQVGAGEETRREVAQRLGAARIILVLVSADYVHADTLWRDELAAALERHDRREALVIPVLLRPVDLGETRLAELRPLPDAMVARAGDLEEACQQVAVGVREAVKSIIAGTTDDWSGRRDLGPDRRHDREPHRDDFLDRVERVAVLRDPGVKVVRHRAPPPFAGILELTKAGSMIETQVVGALDQPITEALVAAFQAGPERRFRELDPLLRSTLIHTGFQAPHDLVHGAFRRGVKLTTFAEYQGLLDFTRYLDGQTGALEADPIYPPWLYVEQPARWSLAAGREEKTAAAALGTLWDLLDTPHPRFVLVLGDFGAGKTFLLHELARRMHVEKHPLVPVLVEMSKLEKQRSLKALLAQHFAMADMGRFDPDAFAYMLNQGRIALLFDGFDELALRLTYDRALEHFETVLGAVQGSAKVVVTSRTQHFLTDQAVRLEMARRAEQVGGYRLIQLDRFGETQIQSFLGNLIKDEGEAEARYRLLDEVKDLLGLSANPRMLAFIAKIEPHKLREAKEQAGEITAAKLYEILIGQWLDFEHARANPPGAPKGIGREVMGILVGKLARLFWARNAKSLRIGEMGEVLWAEGIDPTVVEHMIGSGSLLVRDAEGRFSFVHRSVMEWLVAEATAREVVEKGEAAALGQDEMSELMADFFVSMATRQRADAWASGALERSDEGHAKKNAARVHERLQARFGWSGQREDETQGTKNLEGQDLRGQDWSEVDWRGANLARVDLRGATLARANLRGASLVGASLDRADLEHAALEGADLTEATLAFAKLSGAQLGGAKGLAPQRLRGAKLVGALGVDIAGLSTFGAATPAPGEVPMWVPTAGCSSVTWSPSGDLVASGHDDGTIMLWDAVSRQPIRAFEGHKDRVRSVVFSPDGTTLASGADDRAARLWQVSSGRILRSFEEYWDSVRSVAFSPSGMMLASWSGAVTVRLWEVIPNRTVGAFEAPMGGVQSVAFSTDSETLACGTSDGTVHLLNVSSGRVHRVFKGHRGRVQSVAFSTDGATLVSGSDDRTVRLWEVSSGRALGTFEGHTGGVQSIAFSADGATIASGSADWTVRLWEASSGRALGTFEGHTGRVQSVAFSTDSATLASGSADGTVRFWEVSSGRAHRAFNGHACGAGSLSFSPWGTTLASGSDNGTVRIWEVSSGRVLRAFEGHAGRVQGIAFSPSGTTLATWSRDRTMRFWEVSSGRALRTFKGDMGWVESVSFSTDRATMASGYDDGTVRLWEVSSGGARQAFKGHTGGVHSVAFNSEGTMVASGSDDRTVRLWEVPSGRTLGVLEGHAGGVHSVAFSADGATLATGSADWTVRVWPVSSRYPPLVFEGHRAPVRCVALNPEGTMVSSGSDDGTVRLWKTSSGQVLHILRGQKSSVTSVAFSPDGSTLASASHDGTIRLWDVATGTCLAILLALPEGWAAFTPDGRYKIGGDVAGGFWHVAGLCRFEPGELDPYLPHLRLPDDAPFRSLPPVLPPSR